MPPEETTSLKRNRGKGKGKKEVMRVKGLMGYSAEEGVKEGANGGRRECWVVFGYWKMGEQLKLRFG